MKNEAEYLNVSALTGRLGENLVAERLVRCGFEVVERNYHSRFGEIDIIAQNNTYICFVEVKTRKFGSLENPLEAVTKSKQRKIILTAQTYILSHQTLLQPRFDVAAVIKDRDRTTVEYIENAFFAH